MRQDLSRSGARDYSRVLSFGARLAVTEAILNSSAFEPAEIRWLRSTATFREFSTRLARAVIVLTLQRSNTGVVFVRIFRLPMVNWSTNGSIF
jgi:hypothetical protein